MVVFVQMLRFLADLAHVSHSILKAHRIVFDNLVLVRWSLKLVKLVTVSGHSSQYGPTVIQTFN